MFDDVLLLGKGGRTVYFGSSEDALTYFEVRFTTRVAVVCTKVVLTPLCDITGTRTKVSNASQPARLPT